MGKIAALLSIIFVAGIGDLVNAEGPNFIFTAQRLLIKGSTHEFILELFDVNEVGKIIITLLKRNEDELLAQTEVEVNEGEKKITIPFQVPNTLDYQARIQVNGSFGPDYDFFGEDTVDFTDMNPLACFIQTDKPLYKPEQKVQIRVLAVDSQLKPFGGNLQGDIWVEDPSRIRMAQWKNVSLGNGMKQFEMPLSNEPPFGFWKISANIMGVTKIAHFEVKEYVLPKFQIKVKKPSFVLVTAETISLEICAKYTYGKLVQGLLNATISLEHYTWSNDKYPVIEILEQIEGCYSYDVNVSYIDPDNSYSYRRIHVTANVTEDGTGISQNGEEYIDRISSPLQLSFTEKQKPNFKPGLPYNGHVKITLPDGTPAVGEVVQVCATISRERTLSKWWATQKKQFCRNFTSDENGIVNYVIPPQNTDTISIYIEAKSMRYRNQPSVPGRPTLYSPETSTSLQPWYSPSGSYIQVQRPEDALECDQTHEIVMLFTAKEDTDFKFYYRIVSSGKVLDEGEESVSFTTEDAISGDEELYVDDVEKQLVPAVNNDESTPEDECISDSIKKEMPYIGQVTFSVPVTAEVSPSLHFLVYYIRDDKETIADSAKISVQKCFQNKADMKFGDESKQPGTKTTLTIKASPNSLCGIRVVDKSIILLDSDNPLSIDRVFQEKGRFETGRSYSRNHCNDKFPKAVPLRVASSMSIMPPPNRPWSSSRYEDSLTAFELIGYLVISDLTMLTRPCKSNSYNVGYGGGGMAMASVGVRGGAPGASAFARPAMVDASMESVPVPQSQKRIAESAVDVRTYFPETWLFEMVPIKSNGELTMTKELPHTITEWVGDAVCVNEEDGLGVSPTTRITAFQPFFVSFTLPYSVKRNETVPVIVTVFNYLEDCLAVKLTLEPGNSYTLLSESPEVNVCVCGGKSVTHRFLVKAKVLGTVNFTVSGVSVEDQNICEDKPISDVFARDAATRPLLIEAEGYRNEKVTSFMFCPNDSEDKIFKKKLELSVSEEIVPDSARSYISISGDIMGPTLDGIERLVRLPTGCGEQNMVLFAPLIYSMDYLKTIGKLDLFKNKGTSYMQQGYQRQLRYRHDDGCYSAFGKIDKTSSTWLTAFVLQNFYQAKRYISIDDASLKQSTDCIVSKQQPNGAFAEFGKVLSNSIQGGLKNGQNSSALTSYVLISLLKSNYSNKTVINSALSYVEAQDPKRSYDLALAAYASSLASLPSNTYLDKLYKKATETGSETFWHDVNNSRSTDIEIAAYCVLTHLQEGKPDSLKKAALIVRWMAQQRNAYGGFQSTQDTVVGLEAIAKFATELTKEGPLNLNIDMERDITESLTITEVDKLVVRMYKTTLPSVVDVTAEGTGCGLIQSTAIYYTPSKPKGTFFRLNIVVLRTEDSCKFATIKVSVSYLPENKASNMAIVEMKMVSGFVPNKDSLKTLMTDGNLQLKRYDFANNNLVLYFDEITNEMKNLEFIVEDVGQVQDAKPATATVKDYYETEKYESAEYSIPKCE